jgi:hypothetical protein
VQSDTYACGRGQVSAAPGPVPGQLAPPVQKADHRENAERTIARTASNSWRQQFPDKIEYGVAAPMGKATFRAPMHPDPSTEFRHRPECA